MLFLLFLNFNVKIFTMLANEKHDYKQNNTYKTPT